MLLFGKGDRTLRAKAHREIAQCESLRAEYRRRRSGRWLRVFYGYLAQISLPVGILGMPLSMAMGTIAVGLEFVRQGAPIDVTTAAVLGLHAVQLCGVLMMVVGISDRAFFSGGTDELGIRLPIASLRILVHLPVSDADLKRANTVQNALLLFPLVVFCGVPYALLAWEFSGIPNLVPVIASLAIAHTLTCASACGIAVAYAPVQRVAKQWLWWIGLFVFLGAIFAGFGLARLGADNASLVQFVLFITPSGWVGAALLEGFIRGNPGGWLWLCPAMLTISFAGWIIYQQWKSGFAIREFIVSPIDGRWYGVIERGFRVPVKLPPPPPIFGKVRHQSSGVRDVTMAESPGALSVFEPGSVALRVSLFGEPTHRSWEFLDRMHDNLLSRRERLLMRRWPTCHNLTIQWIAVLAALTASSLFVIWLGRAGDEREFEVAAWGLVATCVAFVPFMTANANAERYVAGPANYLMLYPAGFEEVFFANWKHALIFYSALAPLAALYGAFVSSRLEEPLLRGVVFGLTPVAVCVIAQPFIDCMKLSSATNDTKRLSMWLLWLAGGITLATCSVIAMLWPRLDVRMIAILGAACSSGATWLFYRRAFHRGDFDLLVKPFGVRRR